MRNLSSEIPAINDYYHFSVDPIKDIIYVFDTSDDIPRVVLWNLQNEMVGEVKKPELLNSVICRDINDIVYRDFHLSGFFYNGEHWIVKINPEDVKLGERCGIIVYDTAGNKLGEWMKEKTDGYIARNHIRFALPSALAVSYEIVDESGNPVKFGVKSSGRREWLERILYLEDNNLIDSCMDFCSYWPL